MIPSGIWGEDHPFLNCFLKIFIGSVRLCILNPRNNVDFPFGVFFNVGPRIQRVRDSYRQFELSRRCC